MQDLDVKWSKVSFMQTGFLQLPLGFPSRDEVTFDNFVAGQNREIVTGLKHTIHGESERIVYICGARGQGASHLLKASCHYAHLHQVSSVYLPLSQLKNLSPDVLLGLESLTLICIDDLHHIAQLPEWEEAIFHLYNRVYDAGGRIMMAANDLPRALNISLKDLVSRLSWGIIYQLQSLTDAEKQAIIIARADERGIYLSDEVAKYLLTHCPRHMGALFAVLDVLDKASLAAKRRLTIPFVKEILELS